MKQLWCLLEIKLKVLVEGTDTCFQSELWWLSLSRWINEQSKERTAPLSMPSSKIGDFWESFNNLLLLLPFEILQWIPLFMSDHTFPPFTFDLLPNSLILTLPERLFFYLRLYLITTQLYLNSNNEWFISLIINHKIEAVFKHIHIKI